MTDYAAKGFAQLPGNSGPAGTSSGPKGFFSGVLRFLDSFDRACRAAARYQQLSASSNTPHSGDVARRVYDEYFGNQ